MKMMNMQNLSPRDTHDQALLNLHEQERQLYILQQDLRLKQKYTDELNQNMLDQIEDIKQQKEDLKMMETEMNQ